MKKKHALAPKWNLRAPVRQHRILEYEPICRTIYHSVMVMTNVDQGQCRGVGSRMLRLAQLWADEIVHGPPTALISIVDVDTRADVEPVRPPRGPVSVGEEAASDSSPW